MKKLYALISALIVALLFGGAVATNAYAAPIPVNPDVTDPVLVSLEVSSAETVGDGDEIRVDWVATDASLIRAVVLAFESPTGRSFQVRTDNYDGVPGSVGKTHRGTATAVVEGLEWPAGEYRLIGYTVADVAGNHAYPHELGATPIPDLRFTVAGSAPASPTNEPTAPPRDEQAPELLSATLSSRTEPGVGTTIDINWEIREDVALSSVSFSLASKVDAGSGNPWEPPVSEDSPVDVYAVIRDAVRVGEVYRGVTTLFIAEGDYFPRGQAQLRSVYIYDTSANEEAVRLKDSPILQNAGAVTIYPAATPGPIVTPTTEPTLEPTTEPTLEPTVEPTTEPTVEPTTEPTTEPTVEPTTEPTTDPTVGPTTTSSEAAATTPATSGASAAPTAPAPSNAPGPSGGLATTGLDGSGALALGVGSFVLLAGAAMLLLRRKPADQ